ncbi:enoyl-CoA hydratase/isomerase family protein [Microbacterium esteraromaticum]|uniref:enoyl-CoA hydratase/isomerase family protein n=1 Tax=Microbacterium esteraromaticum TaxID=57043 RepID=UPI001C953D5C|nr:enoyl-CoA hydratase/isomerase family protein [Microbacterium esteraromaticum]MBY6062396.1 enoyl-CoA hydratase/isomerase family protein [Microbacterium esteraromaticum]
MSDQDQQPILFSIDGALAHIVLNRPEVKNAGNVAMLQAIHDAVAAIEESSAEILILSSTSENFSSGADLRESRVSPPELARERVTLLHRVLGRLRELDIPVIAALDGVVVGLGSELAISADIRIVADNTVFFYPEAKVGVPSPSHRLVATIGLARAQDMLLTGRRVHADEAIEWGLATRRAADPKAAAAELAEQLLAFSTHALHETKRGLRRCVAFAAAEDSLKHIEGVSNAAYTAQRTQALADFAARS